jgi:hypothetical protein
MIYRSRARVSSGAVDLFHDDVVSRAASGSAGLRRGQWLVELCVLCRSKDIYKGYVVVSSEIDVAPLFCCSSVKLVNARVSAN